jgi:uncharacterized membrane protein YedE/YeeE
MFDSIADTTLVALVGLFGGLVLGLAARLGRFCTLGAIEDLLYQGSSVRMRMWVLAIGVAVLGSFLLIGVGLLDAGQTSYLSFAFNPFAAVFGGLVFGYGMALAGNCGFGALARLGGGDLRSFVIVLVMGISAYVTLSGPLASLRVMAFPAPPVDGALPGLAHLIADVLSMRVPVVGLTIGLLIVAAALATREMWSNPKTIFWGAMVGFAVTSGWAGTQWVAAHGFDPVPVESHTYSAPLGDMIIYLMTSSGNSLNFGVGSVAGVLLGAFIGSLIKGHFRWEACEDPRELRRQIVGGALMGVGAVVAFGCTIGQGISAFSVLAYSAPVTMASIFAGCAFGLRQLIEGFAPAE